MQCAKHINSLAIILFSLCKIPAETVKVSYFAKKILIFDGTQSFKSTQPEIAEQVFEP